MKLQYANTMLLFTLLLSVALTSTNAAKANLIPRELGSFKLDHAAFVEVFSNDAAVGNPADKYTLFISTFNYSK